MEFTKPELIGLLAILSSTIAVLWTIIKVFVKRDQEDLLNCRAMHEESNKQILELHGKYNYLQGQMDGVKQLSQSVLQKIEQRRDADISGSANRANGGGV